METKTKDDLEKNLSRIKVPKSVMTKRFKIGDYVVPYYGAADDFYGEVVDINEKENKIYVDFNGTIRQQDPDEIRVVLMQRVFEKMNANKINKVASLITVVETYNTINEK